MCFNQKFPKPNIKLFWRQKALAEKHFIHSRIKIKICDLMDIFHPVLMDTTKVQQLEKYFHINLCI